MSFFIVLAAMNEAFASNDVVQDTPAPPVTISVEPIACEMVGEYSMIDATIEPASNVARARLYFNSAPSNEWFYSVMVYMKPEAAAEGATPPTNIPVAGVFRGWLPKPTVKGGPITMHVLATSSDLLESVSPQMLISVVNNERDCVGQVARVGTPPKDLMFFHAATCCGAIRDRRVTALRILALGAIIGAVIWKVRR